MGSFSHLSTLRGRDSRNPSEIPLYPSARNSCFRLIRCRLTDVVNSCPDELSTGIGGISVHNDTVFRIFGCPAGSTVAQSGALFVCFDQCRPIQREMIDAAALYDRRSLASVDDPVRILFMVLFIIFSA